MRKITASIATATLLILSMSVSADVAQVRQCKLADGKTNDELMALSNKWLVAVKEMDNRATVRIYSPEATDAEVGSFIFVFYLPDFKVLGGFQ